MAEPMTKTCLFCGEEFTTTRKWTKYCPGTDHQSRMWLEAYRRASDEMKAMAVKTPTP